MLCVSLDGRGMREEVNELSVNDDRRTGSQGAAPKALGLARLARPGGWRLPSWLPPDETSEAAGDIIAESAVDGAGVPIRSGGVGVRLATLLGGSAAGAAVGELTYGGVE